MVVISFGHPRLAQAEKSLDLKTEYNNRQRQSKDLPKKIESIKAAGLTQMDILKERRAQASELLKMKREIIRKHFDAVSTDMTDYKEVERILKLLDQSTEVISTESALGAMIPDEKLLKAKSDLEESKLKKRKSITKKESDEK